MARESVSDVVQLSGEIGRIAGAFMMRELNRVMFLAVGYFPSVSVASAAFSSFSCRNGGTGWIRVVDSENVGNFLDEAEKNMVQAFFVGFMGLRDEKLLKESFFAFMKGVAERNMEMDIILSPDIFQMKLLEIVRDDKDVLFYLRGSTNLYFIDVDLDKGLLSLNFVEAEEDHFHIQEVEKFPVVLETAVIMNNYYRNFQLRWVYSEEEGD